ncbi:MAG: hypothetical protein NTW86_13385 [Candidatus Sumerlaeota bacterium]|nr:hypothetical protein [Candidatus Sumerlaeota bacterium]
MSFRFSEWVAAGELFNTKRFSTHGYLVLRDSDRPMLFELTGNCAPDLAGWHIRFETRPDPMQPAPPVQKGRKKKPAVPPELKSLAWHQIGPTGLITAARMVKWAPCSATELYHRAKAGEMPPLEWKRCLTIEWFSQNGRICLEFVDPILEFVEFHRIEGVSADHPIEPKPPEFKDEDAGLGVTLIQLDDEGRADIHQEILSSLDEAGEFMARTQDDPYDLVPDDLQRQLDAQAAQTDRAIHPSTGSGQESGSHGEDEDDPSTNAGQEDNDAVRSAELMDALLDSDRDQPLLLLFQKPSTLPRPDDLTEKQAEETIQVLLGQMAMFGVAFHICEHFTAREAYRLLVEKVLQEERFYPELRGSGWVTGFMTSEWCPHCEEENQRAFEDYERKRKAEEGIEEEQ